MVVDRAWARRFFPRQSAVGKRFREGGCTTCPWTTVVGVVSEVKYDGLDKPDQGSVYWPLAGSLARYVVVRARTEPAALLPALPGIRGREGPLLEELREKGEAKGEEPKARGLVVALFRYCMEHPEELPPEMRPDSAAQLPRAVTDYVAGMTDRFAIRRYEKIFLPRSWMV